MPELPDIEMYRKEADKARNTTVNQVDVLDSNFIDTGATDLNKIIAGKKVKEIRRRGKYLFIATEDHTVIVMHFGMTGYLRYLQENATPPDYAKCTFIFANHHKLYYVSKRKLGFIETTEDLDNYIGALALGPDALEIQREDFVKTMHQRNIGIKKALTDQSLIAGIGNVYADEILFHAGIHPLEKTSNLNKQELMNLYEQLCEVLNTAIKKEADISRLPYGYLMPHRREGEKCPRCGGKIKKMKMAARTTYYCPSCQTLKK